MPWKSSGDFRLEKSEFQRCFRWRQRGQLDPLFTPIDHFVLRVLDPPEIARFYREIFELEEEDKALEDSNYYLTDGRVTLVINSWDITNFKGTGIEKPSLDHVGFKVESIDTVRKDLENLEKSDPSSAAKPVGLGPDREARLALLATCRYGKSHLSDLDCVFIDIHE